MVETNFKQTKIGSIPASWDVATLGDSCSIKARIGWQGLTTGEYLQYGDYYLISGTDFQNGFIKWNSCNFVSEWRFKQDKNIQIKEGDVLISKDGTIGKVAFLDAIPGAGTLNSGIFVVRPLKDDIIANYLQLAFKSKYFDDFIGQITAGSTIVHLYQKDIVTFTFPVPSKEEQRRIAEVLSDMDKLISALEKKIAKKQAIKQGAMQQLLTGKKRLPGFVGEWGEKEIGELGSLQKGSVCPYLNPQGDYVEYSMPAFDNCARPSYCKGETMNSSRTIISGDVLLINKLNVRQRRIWLVCAKDNNSVCSGEFLPFESTKCNLNYIRQLLLSDNVVKEWNDNSTGTSNSQKRITPSYVLSYKMFIPQDIAEQSAIAKILDDMDKEISSIEDQRQKIVSLKQGMMQKLLTGQIRLI